MNELDDLSICKRIAEIEGLPFKLTATSVRQTKPVDGAVNRVGHFDPLRDNDLCFRLMVKHNLTFEGLHIEYGVRLGVYDDSYVAIDENPNRAICLAIIKANEGL